MSWRVCRLLIAIVAVAGSAGAATFVVPSDRDLIRQTDAIVIGIPLVSYSQLNDENGIETATSISVEQVIKGSGIGSTINVVEPGGVFGNRAAIIAGAPRFTDGERIVLFLKRTGENRWAATELVLGKFTFRSEGGKSLLVRDASEIVGWDPDLKQHRELLRDAAQFLQFVRDEVGGRVPRANYTLEEPAAATTPVTANPRFVASPSFVARALAFSATSYTMTLSGSQGGRWNVFPSAVSWYMGTTQEPGAPGGGQTAITTAFASWNNDAGSNVNYVFAGVDNGTHTQGLHAADGANTILYERDLSSWGVTPFQCSGSGYGGTLGLGGVSSASGTHTGPNGEIFWTTREADVEMNQGAANCTLLFSNGDWNSAVTHEVGHTLGFRHADQNRASNGACSTDPSLECSSSAIMTATVTSRINAALQPWDVHAVDSVYPSAGNPVPSGTLTASPNPIVTCSNAGATTLTWAFTGVTRVEIHIGSPAGQLFAGGGPTGTVTTGAWVTDGTVFYAQNVSSGQPLTSANTLATVTVHLSCTAGSISATPNPIATCSTTGATTINWNFPGVAQVQIRIGSPTGQLFAAGGSAGSILTGNWVREGMTFYAQNAATGQTLGSVVVHLSCTTGTITATPNPVRVCDGTGAGVTTISWNYPGVASVEIHLNSPSGGLFVGGGSSGSASTGKWAREGLTFYAQNVTGGQPLNSAGTLGTVVVHVTTAGCP